MSLSMLLTLLLVSRLFWLRRKLIKAMGKEHGGVYTSIAAMLVESALPYGIISAVYIILYGLQNPAQSLFLGPLVQVEASFQHNTSTISIESFCSVLHRNLSRPMFSEAAHGLGPPSRELVPSQQSILPQNSRQPIRRTRRKCPFLSPQVPSYSKGDHLAPICLMALILVTMST